MMNIINNNINNNTNNKDKFTLRNFHLKDAQPHEKKKTKTFKQQWEEGTQETK